MKNKEIEKMLKYLKNNTYIPDETKRKYKILHRDEVNLLLSYIEQLEKENDRLKEVVENLTTMTVNGDTKQIKNTAQYKLEQLENNRDKALQYIKETMKEDLEYPDYMQMEVCEYQELIDILKGDSDYEQR